MPELMMMMMMMMMNGLVMLDMFTRA